MAQSRFRMSSCGALLAAISAAFPLSVLAAPAARVEFAVGDPQLTRPGGVAAPLVKGAEVNSGDTIITNKGRVQLRFSDGAYVSLQPASEFRVDDYRFDGRTDGSERGIFSLLKGGLRTITGLVGRTNKKAYQVNTAVATIGIRGTEYTIAYTNSISGSVGEGEIEACNGGGCSKFTNGESFFIPSPEIKPSLTDKKTDLPPQQPGDNPGGRFQSANDPTKPNGSGTSPVIASGDQTNNAGDLTGVMMTGAWTLDGVYAKVLPPYVFTGYFNASTVVFDAKGAVTDLAGTLPAGVAEDFGNDGLIAWGQFKQAANPGPLHYAVGLPVSNLSDLVTAQKVATYELLGATLPTDTTTGVAVGALNSFSLKVDFFNGQASGMMSWLLKGGTYTAPVTGSFDGPLYLSGACTTGVCNVYGQGLPFAKDAARFGVGYQVYATPATGAAFTAVGAAALRQTP